MKRALCMIVLVFALASCVTTGPQGPGDDGIGGTGAPPASASDR